jgi:hypothetical protein
MSRSEILNNICEFSPVLNKNINGIAAKTIGGWSLETGVSPECPSLVGVETQNIDIPHPQGRILSITMRLSDQEERTWLPLLFEAQLAAYSAPVISSHRRSGAFGARRLNVCVLFLPPPAVYNLYS